MPLRSMMLPSEARRPDLGAEPKRFGGERKRRRTAHEGSERALCQTGIDTNPCSPIFEPSLSWPGSISGGRKPHRSRFGTDVAPKRQGSRLAHRPPSALPSRRGRFPSSGSPPEPPPAPRGAFPEESLCARRDPCRLGPNPAPSRGRQGPGRQRPPAFVAGTNARGSPSGHASIDSTRSMSS